MTTKTWEATTRAKEFVLQNKKNQNGAKYKSISMDRGTRIIYSAAG